MSKDKKAKHKTKAEHQNHEQNGVDEGMVAILEIEAVPQDSAPSVEEVMETEVPGIGAPQLEGEYSAAYGEEIATPAFIQRAFLAQLAPGALLQHGGRVRLTEDGLDFEGLTRIAFADIVSLQAHVDRVYHRYYAGLAALGGRGGHMLTGAEPFVITYREGERERSLYVLLDWSFFLTLSKDKGWRKAVGGVLPAKEKKK